MTNTICGHERDALIWALNQREGTEHFAVFDIPAPIGGKAAFEAICDPAKLAELLAEALRDRGLLVSLGSIDAPVRVFSFASSIAVDVEYSHNRMLMSQARAALLRILELPEGATAEDATKALGNASR